MFDGISTERRERHVDDMSEWEAFLRRILRATATRVSDGKTESLAVIARVRKLVDETMQESVTRLRAEPWNYSWRDVGDALGITRQAAEQRFGNRSTSREAD